LRRFGGLKKLRQGRVQDKKDIKEGDKNTTYFFAKANQRRRKKVISCLEDGERVLTENKDLIQHTV
jgi:hypothetical protein